MSNYNVLGDAFGGQVVSIPISETDEFYKNNRASFSSSGVRSFMRALGIPYGFFNKQPDDLQDQLMTSQKSHVSDDYNNMLLLSEDNQIIYAAPAREENWQDPSTFYGIDSSNGWKFRRADYNKGVFRYLYSPTELVRDEYCSVVYMDVPIFYTGKFNFNVGMYKVVCDNGMMDKVSSSGISVPADSIDSTVLNSFVVNFGNSLMEIAQTYTEMLNSLKEKPANMADARVIFNEMQESKKIPKTLTNNCIRHIDLMDRGHQLPEVTPQEIKTVYDVLDISTYYSRELPSIGSTSKSESFIFSFFKDKAQAEIHGLDMEAAYSRQL